MISIINYGLGNLGSIANMLKYIGVSYKIIDSPQDVKLATKLLLPGVGAFDAGMAHLKQHDWVDSLNEAVLIRKVPVLGICLGMQLMTNSSEEGRMGGLSWIKATTHKFVYDNDQKLKIPHMGWAELSVDRPSSLFPDINEYNRFYFVHSYYVKCASLSDAVISTQYGIHYTSGFEKDNIFGVQFHPEKSHKFGIRFFKRFATL